MLANSAYARDAYRCLSIIKPIKVHEMYKADKHVRLSDVVADISKSIERMPIRTDGSVATFVP